MSFRLVCLATILAWADSALAMGLGDLRGNPTLGVPMHVELDLLGVGKEKFEPSCFRLRRPEGTDDLPWLKTATFKVRGSSPPVLEIISAQPLREPVLQMVLQLSCGHDVIREYFILAAPPSEGPANSVQAPAVQAKDTALAPIVAPAIKKSSEPVSRARAANSPAPAARPVPAPTRKKIDTAPLRRVDRLMLSGGGEVGDPALRAATSLGLSTTPSTPSASEAQREVLRLEFRMLAALNEQATTQMALAEKMRNIDGVVAEMQKRTAVEPLPVAPAGVQSAPALPAPSPAPGGDTTPVVPVSSDAAIVPTPESAPPPVVAAPVLTPPPAVLAEPELPWLEWAMYGGVLAALLGMLGWLRWKNNRAREEVFVVPEDEPSLDASSVDMDPKRGNEAEEKGGVDLSVEPASMGMVMHVDLSLDPPSADVVQRTPVPVHQSADSMLSLAAATVDEHFEANPVIELADIMLSFGRVKGAAQALQEYIDNNPQEALQPWIRLMDVYRMAGMRAEFEVVARNLNRNFNVEIQNWEAEPASQPDQNVIDFVLDDGPVHGGSLPPRPGSLEEMPRVIDLLVALWHDGDVLSYMQQLLRDNRGGKRAGFSLPVVEEILFLIDLKETVGKMEKASEQK